MRRAIFLTIAALALLAVAYAGGIDDASTAEAKQVAEVPTPKEMVKPNVGKDVHPVIKVSKPKPPPEENIPWLDKRQNDNVKAIVETGKKMGMPERAQEIAVATARQEGNFQNHSSDKYPVTQKIDPNAPVGSDHDSVGLFQQRPESGWGAPEELMKPEVAAEKFYSALEEVPNYDKMRLTDAAQAVQGSAFPQAYQDDEQEAKAIVDTLNK